jgi:hypothetical protein
LVNKKEAMKIVDILINSEIRIQEEELKNETIKQQIHTNKWIKELKEARGILLENLGIRYSDLR